MKITFVLPAVGRKTGAGYIRSWQMQPLTMATLAGLTPARHAVELFDDRLEDIPFDVILTAEAKSIPIAHELAKITQKPYVVLRKEYKPYMGAALEAETLSITTGKPQHLFLDEKDIDCLKDKKIVVLDDVISTGSTLQGMHLVVEKAGGIASAEAAILTEGDRAEWRQVIALGHLPIFYS